MLQKLRKLRGKKLRMYNTLYKSLGVVTTACEKTGISRQTHYRWLKKDKNYKSWCSYLPDMVLDMVETANFKNIAEGNQQAINLFLKTKGQKRGYVEKQEIEYSGEVNQNIDKVTVRIIDPQGEKDEE